MSLRAPTASAGTAESPWVRRLLIGVALAFLLLFLVLPLSASPTPGRRSGSRC